MPSRFEKDTRDSQHVIRPQLRGTRSLNDLSAMIAENARIDREKQHLGSIREIYAENWQQGVGPHPNNITANLALLKVLNMPDWQSKLQGKGIEVNKPTLQFISRKLKGINPPNPLDYNTAVRNFNKTVQDLKKDLHLQKDDLEGYRDTEQLLVEPAGLRGGAGFGYDEDSQEYTGRFLSLVDPKGTVHTFNKGEFDSTIAYSTAQWYRDQYAARWIRYYAEQGTILTSQQIEYYKNQCNEKGLTEKQVLALLGNPNLQIDGWRCSSIMFFPLRRKLFYTDKGTEIDALELLPYESMSKENHYKEYPFPTYVTRGDPTPAYNCYSIFIDRKAWLVPERRGEYNAEKQIRRILDENGYLPVLDNRYAQIGDVIAYYEKDGSIGHTATVARIDYGGITAESKPGDFGLILHNMYDAKIVEEFGEPIIYHTERGSHLLRTSYP